MTDLLDLLTKKKAFGLFEACDPNICTECTILYSVQYVGGSDIDLFAIFENGHCAAHQVYFCESNLKNRRIWPKMEKTVFDLKNSKESIFLASLHFKLLTKLRNKLCFRCNLKKCYIKKCFAYYRVTVKIFLDPAPS